MPLILVGIVEDIGCQLSPSSVIWIQLSFSRRIKVELNRENVRSSSINKEKNPQCIYIVKLLSTKRFRLCIGEFCYKG